MKVGDLCTAVWSKELLVYLGEGVVLMYEPCNRRAKPVSERSNTSGQKMSLTFSSNRLYYKHQQGGEQWLT